MRVWIISAASAVTAVVLALLIGWEFLGVAWTTILFASISLYATFVAMLSAAVFVADLHRVCRRLATPPQTQIEWIAAFAGTGVARLAHRIFDFAVPVAPEYREILMVQYRADADRTRREVNHLFWNCLMRCQFFSACTVLIIIGCLGLVQAYCPVAGFSAVPPLQ